MASPQQSNGAGASDPMPTTEHVQRHLVVDARYADLVLRALPAGVAGHVADENDVLGLALIELGEDTATGLDDVLLAVRGSIAAEYEMWLPPIGKNRRVDAVIGFPQSKSLYAGPPKQADAAQWSVSADATAGRGVRVGVLDTRFVEHEGLVASCRFGPDDVHVPTGVQPTWAGHATFVAGLVHAQAPAAEIELRGVLRSEDGRASSWDTAVAMARFATSGVDILNLSLGCRTDDGLPPLTIQRAVQVLAPRMLLIAAAGNHGDADEHAKQPTWPAALPGVVAVGAGTRDDVGTVTPASFTPPAPWVRCLTTRTEEVSTYLRGPVRARVAPGLVEAGDVRGVHTSDATPGADGLVEVAMDFGGFASWRGTSFAAATVSGAVAARMRPGRLTAAGALAELLTEPNPVVRRHEHAR